jgi:hypothetical protein
MHMQHQLNSVIFVPWKVLTYGLGVVEAYEIGSTAQ